MKEKISEMAMSDGSKNVATEIYNLAKDFEKSLNNAEEEK